MDAAPPPELARIDAGPLRVTGLRDRDFRLDGGAMFGVVPRALWERVEPADPADHTIPLATRPLLVEGASVGPIVVEPGIGGRWDAKRRRLYRIEESPTIEESLARSGVAPEDVRVVVLTHFHWDHAGAATIEREGRVVPRFPNARHVVPRVEADVCVSGETLRRASYREEDARCLDEAGLLACFDGAEEEVAPGVVVHRLGGHSDGVSVVTIRGGGRTVCFWSDVVPMRHHVHPLWIMAYDLDAGASYAVRRPWIERAAEEGWIGALYHDRTIGFARFLREGERWRAEPWTPAGSSR